MGRSRGSRNRRAKSTAEIAADLGLCNAQDFEIVESLVTNARSRHPRRRERQWFIGPWSKWPLIIGIELMLIGESDVETPPHWAPSEQMRKLPKVVVWQPPRIVVQKRRAGEPADWNLLGGLAALIMGLAWWVWLAHGGEAIALHAEWQTATVMLWAPVALCVLAGAMWVEGLAPYFDYLASDHGVKRRGFTR